MSEGVKHGVIITRDEDCYPGDSHPTTRERWEHGKLIMRLEEEECDYGSIPDYETTLWVYDPDGKSVYTLSSYRNGTEVGAWYTEESKQGRRKGYAQDGDIEWRFEQPYEEAVKPMVFK